MADDYICIDDKGKAGEDIVFAALENAIKLMDYSCPPPLRNSLLPFESVYGRNGFITAEFDIVLFTPFFVFLFEIKNALYDYSDYNDRLWKLKNKDDEQTSNPIYQNHIHKLVFCSEMNIPREQVITVEVLLENGKQNGRKTKFKNDYVFDKTDLDKELAYLIASERIILDDTDFVDSLDEKYSYIKLDCENLHKLFSEKTKDNELYRKKHKEDLLRTEKIEKEQSKYANFIPFRRTDTLTCPKCGGKLCFMDNSKEFSRNYKAKFSFFLGCTNYYKDIQCDYKCALYDEKHLKEVYKTIKPESIESRNDWGEERMNDLFIDEMKRLENEINDIKLNSDLACRDKDEKILELKRLLDKKDRELQEQREMYKRYPFGWFRLIKKKN